MFSKVKSLFSAAKVEVTKSLQSTLDRIESVGDIAIPSALAESDTGGDATAKYALIFQENWRSIHEGHKRASVHATLVDEKSAVVVGKAQKMYEKWRAFEEAVSDVPSLLLSLQEVDGRMQKLEGSMNALEAALNSFDARTMNEVKTRTRAVSSSAVAAHREHRLQQLHKLSATLDAELETSRQEREEMAAQELTARVMAEALATRGLPQKVEPAVVLSSESSMEAASVEPVPPTHPSRDDESTNYSAVGDTPTGTPGPVGEEFVADVSAGTEDALDAFLGDGDSDDDDDNTVADLNEEEETAAPQVLDLEDLDEVTSAESSDDSGDSLTDGEEEESEGD